jgi:hypothetical protein
MSWVKLDDQFFTHPKVQRAGRDARDLFLVGLTYCANHRTDGIVPAEALPLLAFMAGIPDGEAAARKLVEVHLWEEGATGYAVHQYLEYNPSREKIEETRQHRAEAGSKGGKAAHSKREAICSDFASAGLDTDVEQKSTPSPVPVPVPDPVPVPEPRSSADADGGAGAPPPAPSPGKRAQSPEERARARQQQAVVKHLRDHFASVSGISPPRADTSERAHKGFYAVWWNPLRDIAALVDYDRDKARAIISDAIAKMRAEQLTIKGPCSILTFAKDRAGAVARASDKTRYISGQYADRVQH